MTILCIGDSLTYGYGVGRPQTWCSLVSTLTGHDIVNHGVNGATTGEMLEQPLFGDAVFIMGGLNDLFMGMPVSTPLTMIRQICENARKAGIRPAVGIPMPVSTDIDEAWCDGPVDMDIVRTSYEEFAEKLLFQCREDGIETLDLRPLYSPSLFLFDGIHLNRAGHQCVAEAMAAFCQHL
ncbi:MAG: hypothetical protein IKJ34_04875 [Mailhella sp.]|nr:hypothetical protein [Mailhella sp.]